MLFEGAGDLGFIKWNSVKFYRSHHKTSKGVLASYQNKKYTSWANQRSVLLLKEWPRTIIRATKTTKNVMKFSRPIVLFRYTVLLAKSAHAVEQ